MLYVTGPARSAFKYYTAVHPDRDQWSGIRNAHVLAYVIDYDTVAPYMGERSALLYSFDKQEDIDRHQKQLNHYLSTVGHFKTTGSEAFLYTSHR